MRISILTPDISSNGLGRAYILAKVLQRHYFVEIIGPMYGENIWYPLRDDKSMNYKYIKVKNFFNIYNLKQLLKQITGDIIYASKPLMPSFGTGLLKKLTSKIPLILDIDDWELGISKEFYAKLSFMGKFKNFISSFRNCFCYENIFLFEKLIPLADEITVANSFLQNRFGGILIPHGRDADLLNPEHFDRDILRENLGLRDRIIVSYIGTPRTYKGVDDLIKAIGIIQNKDILLLLVGISSQNEIPSEKMGRKRIICFGEQPMAKIGEFLAISDIVVVPQRDTLATKGQFPSKIFDAMAMAKPIVSTAVNDIPQVLKGCGLIAKPGDAGSIAEKINILLQNKDLASELGKNARKKFMEKYSWKVMEEWLLPLFDKYAKV